VGVQSTTGLKRRYVIGPQTMFDLQPGNSFLDVRDSGSCRPLVCVQQPETSLGLAMQLHQPHGTAQPVQFWSSDAMRRGCSCG
jgi:hypothetical protein